MSNAFPTKSFPNCKTFIKHSPANIRPCRGQCAQCPPFVSIWQYCFGYFWDLFQFGYSTHPTLSYYSLTSILFSKPFPVTSRNSEYAVPTSIKSHLLILWFRIACLKRFAIHSVDAFAKLTHELMCLQKLGYLWIA